MRKKTARHDNTTNYNNYLPTDRKKVTCVFVSCRFVGGGGQQSLAPAKPARNPFFFWSDPARARVFSKPFFFPSSSSLPFHSLHAHARTHGGRRTNERTTDKETQTKKRNHHHHHDVRTYVKKDARQPAVERRRRRPKKRTNERTERKKKTDPHIRQDPPIQFKHINQWRKRNELGFPQ